MKLVIDPFDSKSISKAIEQLKQYEKDFLAKEELFVKRLAEIGVSVATVGFAKAKYDGENDVQVTMTQSGTTVNVIAFGESVGFIEFGSGIKFREWDGFGVSYIPPPRGSYGEGKGKQSYGWWYSPTDGGKGEHTYGNEPAEAMLNARDVIIEKVIQIAREVWS